MGLTCFQRVWRRYIAVSDTELLGSALARQNLRQRPVAGPIRDAGVSDPLVLPRARDSSAAARRISAGCWH
jgi:hypothetical protein